MARVAFAWELGGEFGHAMSCAGLARSLAARGHRIALMFRELRQLAYHPETAAYDLFTGPPFAWDASRMHPPSSVAEIMLVSGYAKRDWLTGALRHWLQLFSEWKPDIVVSDYAPTALLAARVLGLPRVSMGISFAVPPPVSPVPAFRFDSPPPPAAVAAVDAEALANVNFALAEVGAPPLSALHELFQTHEDFLCTLPELDAYGNRPTARYWGPRFRDDTGISAHWPSGRGMRVLVYVKNKLPQLDAIISLLATSPFRVIAFIPDLDETRRERLRGPMRIVADKPVRYGPLIDECDLFVSQAGSAATGLVALGVPQLMLPVHYEQYLTATRIEQLGAGIKLMPEATPQDVANALRKMANDPRYRAAAQAYHKRYPAYSPTEQQRRIVMRIEDILAAPSTGKETRA